MNNKITRIRLKIQENRTIHRSMNALKDLKCQLLELMETIFANIAPILTIFYVAAATYIIY